jgi:hypothetical protein
MRWAIVVSLVRKPRAISAVLSPPTRRSLGGAEAARCFQTERHLPIAWKARVAAHEDHPEFVVIEVHRYAQL